MPRSPQWSLSLRFPHQDPIHSPLLAHTRHMPSPSHSSPFYHPHNIGWAVQIMFTLSYFYIRKFMNLLTIDWIWEVRSACSFRFRISTTPNISRNANFNIIFSRIYPQIGALS
jgi:hypothetical protein